MNKGYIEVNPTLYREIQNLIYENEKLQQENKQLKGQLDKYESPEDMTLMYMWCTEKVKDENKQLKKILNEIKSIDIFKEFSFPLMKRWEEQQVLSSIDYQFKTTFIKKIEELEKGDSNDTIK